MRGAESREMRAVVILLACMGLAATQATIKDGPRGTGTEFKKCGGTFFGGSDRCFEVILTKFQVQIGAQGTNEDVRVKVCSDDQKTCCTTPALKKSFSDDWSSNDLEQWGKDTFGPCKGKKFTIKKGLDVTLLKEGQDTLAISSFFIEAEGVTKAAGQKSPERFDCGRFSVVGGRNSSSNFCGTSPYSYERVKEIKVAIGPDGTNDDVSAEFCSDVNSVCCRTKLNKLLSDNWSRNDDEVWKESDLGKCKTLLYKVRDGLRFTLLKNGNDDLQVNKVIVSTENLRGAAFNYDCKDFKLASQGAACVEGVTCKQEKLCARKTTGSQSSSRTTKRPVTGTRATTKKAGVLDRIKGSLGFGGKKTTTTTTRRPTTTTTRRSAVTTTKKAGVLDRIKGSLGFGGKKTSTTRRPTTTTTRRIAVTTTKKAGFLDRIKGSLGLGSKTTATTTTTTRTGLLSQAGSLVTTKKTVTTTTRPPFRG